MCRFLSGATSQQMQVKRTGRRRTVRMRSTTNPAADWGVVVCVVVVVVVVVVVGVVVGVCVVVVVLETR